MSKPNPQNARIKREYFEWQKEANRKSISTIDNIRKAIDRYEEYTNYQDFKTYNKQKAIGFKKKLSQTNAKGKNELLSKSTVSSTLNHLKDFFKWFAIEYGDRKIGINDIEYLNLTGSDENIARSKKRKKVPTLEQVRAVINSISPDNEINMRNRAIIAFTILTGMRDGAIASLRLKHIKIDQELVEQLPEEVKTKFSKTIYTYFFPVGNDIKEIIIDWVNYLYKVMLFNEDDPVFPRTKLVQDENFSFKAEGIEPIHWHSANQIRKIFKDSFTKAGLDYFPPHSFRNTLVRFGQTICKTPRDYKAWSQNLGHEHVLTTFTSYGQIDEFDQGEIITNLQKKNSTKSTDEMIKEIYENSKK